MPAKKPPATGSLFADDPAPPPPDFPADWSVHLAAEFSQPYFAELMRFVAAEREAHTVFPAADEVFNAFRFTPPEAVRVVLLGQDPYPTPGHAHGLAFSVRPGVAVPASLRNMCKELQTDLGIPPARHGNLAAWARRGVLLLNTVLTVRSGEPQSHAGKGWEKFTDAAIRAMDGFDRGVVFLLLGKPAQKKTALVDAARHAIVATGHPSPLAAHKGFFGTRPFSAVNAALEKLGREPIDWRLPDEPTA